MGSTQGMIIQRSADVWKVLPPGNSGDVLNSGGPGGDNFWAPAGSYLSPAFTAFGITGVSTPVDVGATVASGSQTFTWSTSNSSNVKANTISIVDTTGSTTIASGLANSGNSTQTLPGYTNNAPASQVWTISGTNTNNGTFSRTLTVNWLWRVYVGTSSNATLTANQIKALSDFSGLESGFAGTYPLANATGFKYFCFPDSMGNVTLFFDSTQNFPWSMATASDNAAYSNVQGSGGSYSYAIVSVANVNAVSTNYRVYRSQYSFSGTPAFQVS